MTRVDAWSSETARSARRRTRRRAFESYRYQDRGAWKRDAATADRHEKSQQAGTSRPGQRDIVDQTDPVDPHCSQADAFVIINVIHVEAVDLEVRRRSRRIA